MRIALGIEYDGTDFFGWQRLSHGHVGAGGGRSGLELRRRCADRSHCAGRTDAGVHARCQVVHFDTEAQRSERSWMLGANSRLPRQRCRALGAAGARRFSRALQRAGRGAIATRFSIAPCAPRSMRAT